MSLGARSLALQRALVLVSLGTVTVVAWMVVGFGPGTWFAHGVLTPHRSSITFGTYGAAFAMWLAMSVAMMIPPLVPWLFGFAALSRDRGEPPVVHTHRFVAGYLAVWVGYSAIAAALQVGLHQVVPSVESTSWLAATTLVVAGAYQLTSFKCAALGHCRSPLSVLLLHWEPGPLGAYRLGWRHGLYCLGCCWALMAIALALGVMNLVWMAVLTVVIGVEKLARSGERWSRALGVALIVWGGWLVGVSGGS